MKPIQYTSTRLQCVLVLICLFSSPNQAHETSNSALQVDGVTSGMSKRQVKGILNDCNDGYVSRLLKCGPFLESASSRSHTVEFDHEGRVVFVSRVFPLVGYLGFGAIFEHFVGEYGPPLHASSFALRHTTDARNNVVLEEISLCWGSCRKVGWAEDSTYVGDYLRPALGPAGDFLHVQYSKRWAISETDSGGFDSPTFVLKVTLENGYEP